MGRNIPLCTFVRDVVLVRDGVGVGEVTLCVTDFVDDTTGVLDSDIGPVGVCVGELLGRNVGGEVVGDAVTLGVRDVVPEPEGESEIVGVGDGVRDADRDTLPLSVIFTKVIRGVSVTLAPPVPVLERLGVFVGDRDDVGVCVRVAVVVSVGEGV